MTESIDAWWERRQRSKGEAVPYAVGTYREAWSSFPMLVRQYHPEFNRGIMLTQVPPAADVYLTWQCEVGHLFVATPSEQRSRPSRVRRRSVWCPECTVAALGPPRPRPAPSASVSGATPQLGPSPDPVPPRSRAPRVTPPPTLTSPRRSPHAIPPAPDRRQTARPQQDGPQPHVRERGEPFRSPHAPRTASAAEADLRRRLGERLDLDLETYNAVWVAQSFHGRREVWPDIVIAELRVAIEYDTVGRFGLEHVGPREQSDRWKDRVLRQCGWEVVRIRTGKLQPLGEHDVVAPSVTDAVIDRLVDTLADLRGPLLVAAYRR